jgi:outer membrane lipoprotein SlyB
MRKLFLTLAAASLVIPATMALPVEKAEARKHRYYGKSNRSYTRCRHSSGTTGLVAGGVGGALLGNAVGGGVLGTVAGGVGGALGGRAIDRSMTARRRGC